MNIDIHELNRIIADFVQVGYMQAVKVYDHRRTRCANPR